MGACVQRKSTVVELAGRWDFINSTASFFANRLLMFYFCFHLYLNLFAELMRFGDRVFYKDWWNSSEVGSYWRLWNLPVHYWLIRHFYFPLIRRKVGRQTTTFIVFLFSAIMHELLVSIPFHMVRPWSFIGMMMQVPLVAITKYLQRKYPGGSYGNVIFWISFCVVGQPSKFIQPWLLAPHST
jgi:diacylglycerol O-acyltransferase 1